MKPILLYLLQVIICSGLLYGYYHLFLRNKKFHQYNRYYLLIATIASVLIPFLNIPVYFSHHDEQAAWLQTLSSISSESTLFMLSGSSAEEPNFFTWQNIFTASYLLLSVLILFRLLFSIFRIRRLMKKYEVEKLDDIFFVNTEEQGTPFSFFRWMFWNNKITLQSKEGQQIFRHELFHIRQKHSWDIIFIHLLTILFWINPFFHLIKKELKTIHEFLADQFAVEENEQWNYAELLLMQLLGSPNHRLVHPFFHNQIKRRITMITSSQQPKYRYFRKILVLPLLALIAALFAFTYKQKQESDAGKKSAGDDVVTTTDLLRQPLIEKIVLTDTPRKVIPPAEFKIIADKIIVRRANGQNDVEPDLFIINSKKYSKEELRKEFGEKVRFEGVTAIITPPNDAEAIKKYGPQAKNGLLELSGKVMTDVEVKEVPKVPGKNLLLMREVKETPLYVIDGNVHPKDVSLDIIKEIRAEDIVSINVLKGETATKLYGKDGSDGVIEIETKLEKPLLLEKIKIDGDVKTKLALEEPETIKEVIVEGMPLKIDTKENKLPTETQWKKAAGETENAGKLAPVYPNPATNIVTIPFHTNQAGEGEIIVVDGASKTQLAVKTNLVKGPNQLTVNVSALAKGIYFITVTDAGKRGARVYKMVKN